MKIELNESVLTAFTVYLNVLFRYIMHLWSFPLKLLQTVICLNNSFDKIIYDLCMYYSNETKYNKHILQRFSLSFYNQYEFNWSIYQPHKFGNVTVI